MGQVWATVRVGFFENHPLSFSDASGRACGIYPDLVREIAAKEKWDLEFIRDSWAGCLAALEQGRIDLMIAIAPSREQEIFFDFNALPVVTAWGQVFTQGSGDIVNILDLDRKTVGVVDRDISGEFFMQLADRFDILVSIKPFPAYADLCAALRDRVVDAAVMNSLNGGVYQKEYRLFPTPILFNPASSHFAAAKGKAGPILAAVDHWLNQWKSDPASVYHAALTRWGGNGSQDQSRTLAWILGICGAIGGLALFLLFWNRVLGKQLRSNIQELEQSGEKYKALADKALVGLFRLDGKGRLTAANKKLLELFDIPLETVLPDPALSLSSLFAHPDQFDRLRRDLKLNGAVEGRLVEFITPAKRRLWGSLYLRKDKDRRNNPVFEGILEDITRRYRREQLLKARLDLSQMSGNCTPKELVQRLLTSAEQLTDSAMGGVHFLSQDQPSPLGHIWSDQLTRYQPDQEHHPMAQAGVWADCITTKAPAIHNDYGALSFKKGVPQGLPLLVRTMGVPVIREQTVCAVLAVGNKATPYDDIDLESMGELSDTAWEIILKNQAKTELLASESRYRQFIETAMEGIWVLDPSFHTTFVNATMAAKLKADPEALLGMPMESFIHEDDRASHHQWLAEIRDGIRRQHEGRFKKSDGTEFWAIVSATPLKGPEKDFTGIFAMFTDITDRKRAEQESELAHQRLLTILNGIDSTIYVADMETHKILFMNDHMKQLFGQDLTGSICWKAFRNQDGPCPHCTNPFLLDAAGQPTGIHLWEEQHPVTGRWNIYHDRAVEWVEGRMARLQIATDITQMKQLEVQQREYENQIRQVQKMEALGALAGGIAHDFNNILFPILGYAELLQEEFREDHPSRKGLDEIVKGAGRARALVEQILTFSRQTETRVAPLKPELIVKEVIKLIRATLPATISIKSDIARNVNRILADPTQLHQVAMNLITNAFHAMEATGGTLTVRLENSPHPDKPGPHVLFSVSDTGPGMDPRILEKIFDPYFTTKPEGKGTGLGLSVVHGIVKKYQGEIQVHTEPGKGACFNIYLPAAPQTAAPELPPGADGNPRGTERILLVDDEPQVLHLARVMLERLGYRVTTCNQSHEALEQIRAAPQAFDLVITDMTMPAMSGDILTEKIKALNPYLPVIICTGFSERLNPERIADLGIKSVLLKPVSKADLARTVRAALDNPLTGS